NRTALPLTTPNTDVAATSGTSGAASNRPNPRQASIQTPANPPAPPAPAPAPTVAASTPAPAAAAAPATIAALAQQPDSQTPLAPPAVSTDHAADVSAPKHADAKRPKAAHKFTSAAKRNRVAHARAPGAQPALVRVYDLPDGRRIYQRIRGDEAGLNYPGGEIRRGYLAPHNRG